MDYNAIVNEIKEVDKTIESLKNQIYVPKKTDKNGLHFSFVSIKNDHWRKATIEFMATHGSYGNSSASDDMSEALAIAVTKALVDMEPDIIHKAISLLEKNRKEIATNGLREAEKIIELSTSQIKDYS